MTDKNLRSFSPHGHGSGERRQTHPCAYMRTYLEPECDVLRRGANPAQVPVEPLELAEDGLEGRVKLRCINEESVSLRGEGVHAADGRGREDERAKGCTRASVAHAVDVGTRQWWVTRQLGEQYRQTSPPRPGESLSQVSSRHYGHDAGKRAQTRRGRQGAPHSPTCGLASLLPWRQWRRLCRAPACD
jgi:hypothetical protein